MKKHNDVDDATGKRQMQIPDSAAIFTRPDSRIFVEMFEKAPIPLVLADQLKQVIGANEAAARLFGFDSKEFEGIRLSALAADTGFLFGKKARSAIQMLRKKDQTVFPAQTYTRELSEGDRDLTLVSIIEMTSWWRAKSALSKRLRYEEGLARCSAVLLKDRPGSLDAAMEVLREISGAFRVSMFEKRKDPRKGKFFTLTHESASLDLFLRQNGSPFREKLFYAKDFLELESLFSRGKPFAGRKSKLPVYDGNGSGSRAGEFILMIPVMVAGSWSGLLSFESKDDSTCFGQEDISLLKTAAEMIGSYLERRADKKERQRMNAMLAQSRKMEAIGTLSAGIAHDFNNLLFPIMAYCEMCQDKIRKNPEQAENYLREILKASGRAKDLVRQILAFSHQGEEQPKPLKIQPIVKECLAFLRATIPASIRFKTKIDAKAPLVMADPARIHQVIMNLCTNAFHAMKDTGGALKIAVQQVDIPVPEPVMDGFMPKGSYVCLEIGDTGYGMDVETMERIFDPYFTTKPIGTGTGVGLSVVHGIVKDYKGYIKVSSAPGKGSVFRVFLPEVQPRSKEVIQFSQNKPQKGKGFILLVDDDDHVRESLALSLRTLGYGVVGHGRGKEALAAFESAPESFDLVITDMTMEDLSGLDLAERIKKISPELPVVLCTGSCIPETEKELAKSGIAACLLKPVIRKDLADTLHGVLLVRGGETGRGKTVVNE